MAPNAPCWVTVHTDGEGGCVHVHATIANHDLETGNAIAHGTDHAAVKRKNDQLSRQMGFSVVGPGADVQRTRWADRKNEFEPFAFERILGNRVEDARNEASNMDEFREGLRLRGVELNEVRKVDKETGEETVGWSYKTVDPLGKSRRKRRRRASNLADDLTKEGIEAYFEERQRQAEALAEAKAQEEPQVQAAEPEPLPVQEAEPEREPVTTTEEPQEAFPEDGSFGTCFATESDVAQMADALQTAHIDQRRKQGKRLTDDRFRRLVEAKQRPDEQLARLRGEVDAARANFRMSKQQAEELRRSKCPTLLNGMWLLAKTACDARDPVSRMMADMTAMMLREMILRMQREQLQRQREEAERRLYESRADMWDAEKRLKAAEKAVGNEDARERRESAKRRDRMLDRLGGVGKRQAEVDKQYDE